ncbi:MAG: Crp/Fnr family transcriptional regulator [Calditrichia bacterium]
MDTAFLPQFLQNAPDNIVELFEKNSISMSWKAGEILAYEGGSCTHFFIVISGNIRVYKPGDTEREITLYHVTRQQSCILTGFCLLSHNMFPAFATAESDVQAVLIPADLLRDWVARYDVWREFLFASMSVRLTEILTTLEKIAFQRLDSRIAHYLLSLMQPTNMVVEVTHAELARELGSSRVAISRVLEQFSKAGIVRQQRGKITIVDRAVLKNLCKSDR